MNQPPPEDQFEKPTVSPSASDSADSAEQPTIDLANEESVVMPARSPARRFGKYELEAEIARGGMGVVFKARQVDLHRVVALKMILSGQLASEEDVKRFYAEARASAALHHPNIVGIHDFGEIEGQHYFSMDFVEGRSLADEIRENAMPPRRAADLVAKVCDAIHYAHGEGILHRDLKPANILLSATQEDTTTESGSEVAQDDPRVTDFGLAKRIGDDSDLTGTGQVLGTPAYMPPEQAAGRLDEIGVASDVYSLGAVLYELLTGRPPFVAGSPLDTLMRVLQDPPVPPIHLNPAIPRDLDTICLRCLEKEPARRYESALQVGDELRRFLSGEPIQARPVSAPERAWRWCRRNPVVSILSGLASALLLAFAIGGPIAAIEQARLTAKEMEARKKADFEADRARQAVKREEKALRRSENRRELLRGNLYAANIREASEALRDSVHARRIPHLLQGWMPVENAVDLRDWEWFFLANTADTSLINQRMLPVLSIAPHPHRDVMALGKVNGKVEIWDPLTNKVLTTIQAHSRQVFGLAWSPNGKRLASVSPADREVRIWEVEHGVSISRMRFTSNVVKACWSPDGKLIATTSLDGPPTIRDAETGAVIRELKHDIEGGLAIDWSPDGSRLATGTAAGAVLLWDPGTGKLLKTISDTGLSIWTLAFDADGQRLAFAGFGDIGIWSAKDGSLKEISTQGQKTFSLAWHGDRLAGAGLDNTVRVWDAIRGAEVVRHQHRNQVYAVAWHRDGRHIVSSSMDATVRVWSLQKKNLGSFHQGSELVYSAAWSADGGRAAWLTGARQRFPTSRNHRSALYVREKDDASPRRLTLPAGRFHWFDWSPKGDKLVTSSSDNVIRIWDAATGEARTLAKDTPADAAIRWSPDGELIALSAKDQVVKIMRVGDAKIVGQLRTLRGTVLAVDWRPDSKRLAVAKSSYVEIWDVTRISRTHRFLLSRAAADMGGRVQAFRVRWDPSGRRLAVATGLIRANIGQELQSDGQIQLWDISPNSAKRSLLLEGHVGSVADVSWSPNGKRIASASFDGTVKIWDVHRQAADRQAGGAKDPVERGLVTLRGHQGQVTSVSWNVDGTQLLTAGNDGHVRHWDALQGYLRSMSPRLLARLNREVARQPTYSRLLLRARALTHLAREQEAAKDFQQATKLAKEHQGRTWMASSWWVAGPFLTGSKSAALPQHNTNPHEPIPLATVDSADKPRAAHWQPSDSFFNGLLSFERFTSTPDRHQFYALARIYSVQDQTIVLRVNASGSFVFWCNGERLYGSRRSASFFSPVKTIPAELNRGWNTILVRIRPLAKEQLLWIDPVSQPSAVAMAYTAQKRWQKALAAWNALIEDAPKRITAYTERAKVHQQLGTTEAANTDVSIAAELHRQIAQQYPRATWPLLLRASLLGGAGRFAEAAADYGKLRVLESQRHWYWYRGALCELEAGNSTRFSQLCRDAMNRFGKTTDPTEAARLAKIGLLIPGTFSNIKPLKQLAEIASSKLDLGSRSKCWADATLALAQFRAGDLENALVTAAAAQVGSLRDNQANCDTMARLITAMAQHKAGNGEQGRHFYRDACRRLDNQPPTQFLGTDWDDRLVCRALRIQADELFGN